ncbi:MAG: lysophospholipase [Ruminiclostridium sp.]|nr:lysophospholipase [Ruminiclostridium sp.]
MPEFKDFTFPSSTGNNTIHVRKCIPETEPRGIVQIVHGIAEHIGRYEQFMSFLAEHGFIAVGNDHLGHGQTALTPEELGIFSEKDGWKNAVSDLNILHDIMCTEYPGLPYIFFGHSMGSFLTRTYLIRYPDKPDLAILSGTGHQPKVVVKAGLTAAEAMVKMNGPAAPGDKLNKIAFGSYNDKYENVRTEFDWLCSDPDVVDKYIADEKCGFVPKTSMFRDMMSGIDFITDPAQIAKMNRDTPVFFIAGWRDPVGDYGKGVTRAYKAFIKGGMKHVRIKLYPGARHELLNEPIRGEVMNDVLEWIEGKLSSVKRKDRYSFYGWENADVSPVDPEFASVRDPRVLYDLLSPLWCEYTCAPRLRSQWSSDNRTLGQCSITAFLAQDIFGGKVYGVPREGGNFHCYNVVGDCVFDLTSEQFGDEKLNYEDNPEQLREVHFASDEKRERYEFLRDELKKYLS